MNRKSLIVALATFALVSCGNNKRMPEISESEGIELAAEMYKRHTDPSFTLPNTFTITMNSNMNSERKTPSDGHDKHWENDHTTFEFSLDEIYCKTSVKHSTENVETEYCDYQFYDNGTGIFYSARNDNGYKTKLERKTTPSDAKDIIEACREILLPFITDDDDFLYCFPDIIGSLKQEHEEYKNETDQYSNYFIGSNDAKSLQLISDWKFKDDKTDDKLKYEGYRAGTQTQTYKNDLVVSKSQTTNTDMKSADGKFYIRNDVSYSTITQYGNFQIDKPNMEDFILI